MRPCFRTFLFWGDLMQRYFKLMTLLAPLALACTDPPPNSLETTAATTAKITFMANEDVPNPTPDTRETWSAGANGFAHCTVCHGSDGRSTGVEFAKHMDPPVPDLTGDIQKYTDGQLKRVIEFGVYPSGMPAWGRVLSQNEIWQIVRYLRHLPAQGESGLQGESAGAQPGAGGAAQ